MERKTCTHSKRFSLTFSKVRPTHFRPAFLFAFIVILFASISGAQNFAATPLIDYQPGETYLNTFPGFLYEGSNTMPVDHDSDGLAAAARIQPLNPAGKPSPQGKIVLVGMGFSNWTYELCHSDQAGVCGTSTFLAVSAADPTVNHQSLVIVDCAVPSQGANRWLDDTYGNYTHCLTQLQAAGVTEAQVQIIFYKNGHLYPKQSLSATTVCSPTSAVDACRLERDIATAARYLKIRYPN